MEDVFVQLIGGGGIGVPDVLNKGAPYAWERVWSEGDVYGLQSKRAQRARNRMGQFLNAIENISPSHILDIGCGSGEALRLMAEKFPYATKLHGIDKSPYAVSLAQERITDPRISVAYGDALHLPFDGLAFDLVTAFGLFEHIWDHQDAIAEAARVTAPGGYIIITTSNSRSYLQIKNRYLERQGQYDYGFQRNWRPEEISDFLGDQFELVRYYILQGSWDMPIVRVFDTAAHLFDRNWGRYITIVARKIST